MIKKKNKKPIRNKYKELRSQPVFSNIIWVVLCVCFIFPCFVVSFIFINILIIDKSGKTKYSVKTAIMKRKRAMMLRRNNVKLTASNQAGKTFEIYFESSMVNKSVNPCKMTKFYDYACGKSPVFSRNTDTQILTLMKSLNKSLLVGTGDGIESQNRNLIKFYNSCMNKIKKGEWRSLKICGKKTVGHFIRFIDSIRERSDLKKLLKQLVKCTNFHFYPIMIDSVESPLILELGNDDVKYFHHNVEMTIVDSDSDFAIDIDIGIDIGNFDTIRTGLKPVSKSKDGLCLNSKHSNFLDWIYESDETLCFSSKSYFSKFSDLVETVDLDEWRNYLKHSILTYINKFITFEGSKRTCRDLTVEYLPLSYCDAFKNKIQGIEKISKDVYEFSKKMFDFFVTRLDKYPSNCKPTDYSHIKKSLSELKLKVGSCEIFGDNKRIQYERKVQFSDNLFENVLKIRKLPSRPGSIIDYLTKNFAYYDRKSHSIIVPIGSIIEPRYSMLHGYETKLATIGFTIGHEIFHSFINVLKFHEGRECTMVPIQGIGFKNGEDDEEQVCDIMSLELCTNMIENTSFNKKLFFETLAQYLCHEIKWKYDAIKVGNRATRLSSKGRITRMLTGSLQSSKNVFKSTFCVSDDVNRRT
jgi:hypothetical protein